jgi:hypothetical protein
VDCFILTDQPLTSGSIVEGDAVGPLEQIEDGEIDHKILMVLPGSNPEVDQAGLVNQLAEARDEKRLMRLQTSLAKLQLLIIDELGYVPLSQTGAELLFEIISQRYERGSTIVTSNLAFEDWTSVFGSERLTGAQLDRLTHHAHILEMNGESYRLMQSKARKARQGR